MQNKTKNPEKIEKILENLTFGQKRDRIIDTLMIMDMERTQWENALYKLEDDLEIQVRDILKNNKLDLANIHRQLTFEISIDELEDYLETKNFIRCHEGKYSLKRTLDELLDDLEKNVK